MVPTAGRRQKNTPAAISLNRPLTPVADLPNVLATIGTAMPIPLLNVMCAELHGRKLWDLTTRLVPTTTVAIYFGELIFATAIAIALLVISTPKSITAIPFCCGLMAWTLAE